MNQSTTIQELLNILSSKKLLQLEVLEPKITRTLSNPITTPLSLIVLETIGALLTTVFLLGLLQLLELLNTHTERTILGLLFTVAGLTFHYSSKNLRLNAYFKHTTLYIIVAGNTLLLWELFEYFPHHAYYPVSIPLIAISLPMYILFKNQAYRFFSALICFTTIGFETLQKIHPIVFDGYLIALLISGGIMMTQQRFPLSLKTVGYAVIASIIANLMILDALGSMPYNSMYSFTPNPLWLLQGGFTLSLFYLMYSLAGKKIFASPWLFCLPLLLVMGFLLTPGLLFALMLLIAGYGYYERILTLSGLVLFPLYLFHYYYALNTSLLNKSLLLMSSGALLIILFLFVRNRLTNKANLI